jgi:DNA modification methylase
MPEALVERILLVASKGDELVYDSFMGSGTTAVVCNKFNLKWIGSELNIENYENAKARIDKESKILRLNFDAE